MKMHDALFGPQPRPEPRPPGGPPGGGVKPSKPGGGIMPIGMPNFRGLPPTPTPAGLNPSPPPPIVTPHPEVGALPGVETQGTHGTVESFAGAFPEAQNIVPSTYVPQYPHRIQGSLNSDAAAMWPAQGGNYLGRLLAGLSGA